MGSLMLRDLISALAKSAVPAMTADARPRHSASCESPEIFIGFPLDLPDRPHRRWSDHDVSSGE